MVPLDRWLSQRENLRVILLAMGDSSQRKSERKIRNWFLLETRTNETDQFLINLRTIGIDQEWNSPKKSFVLPTIGTALREKKTNSFAACSLEISFPANKTFMVIASLLYMLHSDFKPFPSKQERSFHWAKSCLWWHSTKVGTDSYSILHWTIDDE